VVHRVTGEVMVIKQLLEFDREAQETFLKEVRQSVDQSVVGCACWEILTIPAVTVHIREQFIIQKSVICQLMHD